MTPAALAALAPEDWERVRFAFAPAFRVVRATHDVAPVVEAVAAGEDPARPAAEDVAYLVTRAGAGVRTERLAPREAAVLEALLAGAHLPRRLRRRRSGRRSRRAAAWSPPPPPACSPASRSERVAARLDERPRLSRASAACRMGGVLGHIRVLDLSDGGALSAGRSSPTSAPT